MEKEMFSLKEYKKKYWADEKVVAETMEFRKKQSAAAAIELKAERAYHAKKDAELAELKAKGMSVAKGGAEEEIPESHEQVTADVSANVWKVLVKPGDAVKENATLIILECMKMELSVVAPCDGTVRKVCVAEHGQVTPGTLRGRAWTGYARHAAGHGGSVVAGSWFDMNSNFELRRSEVACFGPSASWRSVAEVEGSEVMRFLLSHVDLRIIQR